LNWIIDYIADKNIVKVTTSGFITWDEQKKMVEEIVKFGEEKGAGLFLTDHRNLVQGLSILQIDDLPQFHKQVGVKPSDKIAILYAPKDEDQFKFFQSVSFLASLNFKIFTDEKEAMDWLLEE
jgi:hypothetical protein